MARHGEQDIPIGTHVLNKPSHAIGLCALGLLHQGFDLVISACPQVCAGRLTTPGRSLDLVLISLDAYTLASPT
jgi:hypothetical protein